MKGFSFVRELARLTLGSFAFIYGIIELAKEDSTAFGDATLSSLVQLFVLFSGLLVLSSVIGAFKEFYAGDGDDRKGKAGKGKAGVSSFIFVLAGLVAGAHANKIDKPSSVLTFGKADPFPALFVSSGVLIALEWIVDMIYEKKDKSEGDDEDARHVRRSSLVAVIASLVFLLFGFLLDESLPTGSDGKYNATKEYDVSPGMFGDVNPQHGVFTAFLFGGLSIVALSVSQFPFEQQRRIVLTGSGLAAAAAGSIALEVGRQFHKQHYESRLLPTQFWYIVAGLFALQGSRLAAMTKKTIDDLKKETKGENGGLIMSALTFTGTLALILSGFWFDTYDGELTVSEDAKRGDNYKNKTYTDADVLKAREFGSYTLYLIGFIGLSVFLFKAMELSFSKTLQKVACCKSIKSGVEPGRVMTHRAEAMIVLSLSFALFAGARDPNGAEAMKPEKFSVVGWLWPLLIVAIVARLISFFDFVQQSNGYGSLSQDEENAGEVKRWCIQGKAHKFWEDKPVREVAAILLLGVSGVAQAIATYWSKYRNNEKTSEFHVQAVAFWLTVGHFVLVVLGAVLSACKDEPPFYVHAGVFPFVRFAVSSGIVALLSIATGINIVEGGHDQMVIAGLVSYLLFDMISEEKY